ncbi:TIGR03790 family protein [Desulfobulbus propionicus]|jgi:uncharacterized protein (TIGR03790 family)
MPTRASQISVKISLALLWVFLAATAGHALQADEIMVIANSRANDSLGLARYYMQRRGIPADHLIRVSTVAQERCTREAYHQDIRVPVRRALERQGANSRIRCLVTMYGVPLAIQGPEPSPGAPPPRDAAQDSRAALDSELALVLTENYPLAGWMPNPYFLGFQGRQTQLARDTVLMVSRLDGPDPATVRRLIDDAMATENKGLQGQAWFDARWPLPQARKQTGYALYDASIHKAAEKLSQSGRMIVHLDQRNDLYQPGDCPQAALYCGWYSLGRYVDAFTWVRGAVGYHIASAECTTLRQQGSQVWCKRMLERGIAATIGPVNEPYVQAFPLPELFFPLLAEGYLSLGETYLVTLPYLSWQMVLIGDPLYQPFKPQSP